MAGTEQRLQAQIASFTRWGRVVDRTAETAPMRRGFEERFVRMAIEEAEKADPDAVLSDREIAIRAEALRRAHFCRMALKATQARRAKAAAKRASGVP